MAQESSKLVPVLPRKPLHRMMESGKVPLLKIAPWLPDLSFLSCTSCRRHKRLGNDTCNNSDVIE